jgi:MYXO-CTERM domain-containing protein
LFAALAHAEWQDAGVPGVPNDVQVWGVGTYTVSNASEAWLFQADGGTQSRGSDLVMGTYLTPDGCLVVLDLFGNLQGPSVGGPPECAAVADNVFGSSGGFARRMRHDEQGHGYIASSEGPSQHWLLYSPTGATTGSWESVSYEGVFDVGDALDVLHHNGESHALYGDDQDLDLLWSANGQPAIPYMVPAEYGATGRVRAVALFNGGRSNPTAVAGTSAGLVRLELGSVGATPFSPVQLPGGPASVAGVDVNTGAGSPRADGFGMAVVQRDGGTVVLSAVPTNDLSRVAEAWEVNPTFPARIPGYEKAALQHVSCHGAESCVFTVNQNGGSNLLIYRNAHAPGIAAPAELRVAEGQDFTQFVPVTDEDGDALLVAAPSFSEGPLTVSASRADGGVAVRLQTGSVCADYTARQPVTLFAADGLARHEREVRLPVTVLHTVPPGPPSGLPQESTVVAGSASKTFQVRRGNGCPPNRYIWTAVDSTRPLQESGGDTATFPTPGFACAPERHVYQVQAADDAGISEPREFVVRVQPYGPPLAAFEPEAVRTVVSGTSAEVKPVAFHPCSGPQGLPMRTVWTRANGGSPPVPGLRVRTDTGEVLTPAAASVSGSSLVIDSLECTSAMLPFTVHHEMTDGTGLRGPDSSVTVRVEGETPVSLASGKLVLHTTSSGAGELVGTVKVENLNCLSRRNLRAEVRMTREEDGSLVGQPLSLAPGEAWRLPLEEGCQGGTFRVSGQLVDEASGEPGLTAAPLTVTTPKLKAALGPLAEAPSLVARCGQGARGTFVQTLPADACPAVNVSWTQVGGPPLQAASFSGTQLEVSTSDTGLEALVGQQVVLRVTADAGRGNVATREHVVPISVAPFVDVRHETEKPTGSESGLLGVSVGLSNTTSCGVSEVTLEERLEDMEYVPGSARLDGQPVDVEVSGGLLRVRGLSLAGGTSRRFTYVANSTLLGSPRFQAQVLLREVPISAPPPLPSTDSGCGCTSGGSGAAAFGLAALGMLATRRRRRG